MLLGWSNSGLVDLSLYFVETGRKEKQNNNVDMKFECKAATQKLKAEYVGDIKVQFRSNIECSKLFLDSMIYRGIGSNPAGSPLILILQHFN